MNEEKIIANYYNHLNLLKSGEVDKISTIYRSDFIVISMKIENVTIPNYYASKKKKNNRNASSSKCVVVNDMERCQCSYFICMFFSVWYLLFPSINLKLCH